MSRASPPPAEAVAASAQNDTLSSTGSLYDSALDNLTASTYTSLNGSSNNNSCTDFDNENNSAYLNFSTGSASSADADATLNGDAAYDANTNIGGAGAPLTQSESVETNASSQEEVDPKSLLANKTIFRSDNPNLSIIEISDNSIKGAELENSVVLVEAAVDEESRAQKRRRKPESLIHTSKQKLNVAIAEASAAADASSARPADAAELTTNDVVSVAGEECPTKRVIQVYDDIEEFERNLPSTVTALETPFGSKVYLVGTAHFSEESQDDVSYVIRNVRPDVVVVELCPSRIHILKLDEKTLLEEAKNINLAKVRSIIQAHGYINGIFFILLLQMNAQIAKNLGMAPGGEFRRAFEEVHKLPGCILHLGDRPIRITLHRALRALSLWQTVKLVWRLTSSESISIEEVEKCKQRDLLEKLMQEMAGEYPAFADVFVKERDLYLCHSLQMVSLAEVSPGGLRRPVRVVGVVGIGHAKGIARLWGSVKPQSIPAIMVIPPASLSNRVCKYTLKYGLLGLTLFGAFKLLRPRLTRFF